MKNEKKLNEMETLFLALADKTRLRLLNLMRENEVCVLHFTEVTGESQPKISRHLAYLRNAGIVSTERTGKWINYRIAFSQNPLIARILKQTLEALAAQVDMREDYEILTGISNSSASKTVNDTPQTSGKTNMNFESRELEIFLL